jgi:hypothetical protein
MIKQKLSSQQKKILRSASNTAIISTLNGLNKTFKRSIWLNKTNRYRVNTVSMLKKHDSGKVRHNYDLGKYIAVTPILHCFDSWVFLGRALSALSRGDAHTSHHLAYYAELRAAMSLLAGEGIGIFNSKHYIVNNANQCELIPDYRYHNQKNTGTHIFSWLALEHWAGLKRSSFLLQQTISPSGVPLSVWLDGFGAGENARIIGSDWLKSWGLDLKTIGHDHEGRNEVSYRPNYLNYQSPIDLTETSNFILRLWELFQPAGSSRFETMDRFLLRLSIRRTFSALTGNNPEDDFREFVNCINRMLLVVNPQGLPHEAWVTFLADNQSSIILDTASVIEDVTLSNKHHFSVIARAALLLRVASGAAARIIMASSLTKEDISFWWRSYGQDFGLLNPVGDFENMNDLWADIEIALTTINDWQANPLNRASSYYQWGQDLGKELKRLEECERVSLWGMGL